jgi:hypothetical protein
MSAVKPNKNIFILLCLVLIPVFAFAQAAHQLSYENEAMGVKMSAPAGWFMTSGNKVQQALAKGVGDLTSLDSIKEAVKKVGVLVMFSQYEFGSPVEYNPNVALITEPLPKEYIKNVTDYANASLMNIRTMFKDVKVTTDIKVIKLGDKDAAHFAYEGTMVRGYLEMRIKSSVYLLLKDDLGYTITCTDKADHFSKNSATFESIINTLKLK